MGNSMYILYNELIHDGVPRIVVMRQAHRVLGAVQSRVTEW